MNGAHIGGQLVLTGSTITNEKGIALDIDHANIGLGLAAAKLNAKGQIHLHHARIGCQVTFDGTNLSSPEDRTVRADHLIVDGSLLITDGACIEGQIDLHGAEIECGLAIRGAKISARTAPAFQADAIQVGGNLLGEKCHITHGLDLRDAKVGGSVWFAGASFEHDGKALDLSRAQISGSLELNRKFSCKGSAWLFDATIGTNLTLTDSVLSNAGQLCLNATGLRIQGDLIGDRVKVNGLFDLAGLRSGGDVRLADSELIGAPAQRSSLGSPIDQRKGGDWRGISLRMTAATVKGDVDLRASKASNSLNLKNAKISRSILLTDASLNAPEGCALVAAGATAVSSGIST